MSPAQIAIQPVQVHSTGFHQQEACQQSPSERQTDKKEGILGVMQINTITEESPDAGNPVVASQIFESLKAME